MKNSEKKYVRNLKNFEKYFSKEVIDREIGFAYVGNFVKKQVVCGPAISYYISMGFKPIGKEVEVFDEESETVLMGRTFILPSDEQLGESYLIKACLRNEFGFLNKCRFDFSCFHLDRDDDKDEVVLNCFVDDDSKENGYLLIPIKALVLREKSIIIDRMMDYANSFKGEKKEKVLSVLNSIEAKALFSLLDISEDSDITIWKDNVRILRDEINDFSITYPIKGNKNPDGTYDISEVVSVVATAFGVDVKDVEMYTEAHFVCEVYTDWFTEKRIILHHPLKCGLYINEEQVERVYDTELPYFIDHDLEEE